MEQAVCQLGNANRGECFHIAQLWCVVIDNSKGFTSTLRDMVNIDEI